MVLPETHLREIIRWCEHRVPEHARHQVRVEHEVRGSTVTILEIRAPWREDYGPEWSARPAAQLRYVNSRWRLYWPDRNTHWHVLDDVPPATTPGPLLALIDEPGQAIWWPFRSEQPHTRAELGVIRGQLPARRIRGISHGAIEVASLVLFAG